MNATDPTLATILQTQGNLEHYHIPNTSVNTLGGEMNGKP